MLYEVFNIFNKLWRFLLFFFFCKKISPTMPWGSILVVGSKENPFSITNHYALKGGKIFPPFKQKKNDRTNDYQKYNIGGHGPCVDNSQSFSPCSPPPLKANASTHLLEIETSITSSFSHDQLSSTQEPQLFDDLHDTSNSDESSCPFSPESTSDFVDYTQEMPLFDDMYTNSFDDPDYPFFSDDLHDSSNTEFPPSGEFSCPLPLDSTRDPVDLHEPQNNRVSTGPSYRHREALDTMIFDKQSDCANSTRCSCSFQENLDNNNFS